MLLRPPYHKYTHTHTNNDDRVHSEWRPSKTVARLPHITHCDTGHQRTGSPSSMPILPRLGHTFSKHSLSLCVRDMRMNSNKHLQQTVLRHTTSKNHERTISQTQWIWHLLWQEHALQNIHTHTHTHLSHGQMIGVWPLNFCSMQHTQTNKNEQKENQLSYSRYISHGADVAQLMCSVYGAERKKREK